MKSEKDKFDGKWYLYLGKDSFIHSHNDWAQIWGKWNWISFHLINIYFENDIMTGGIEFEFIVLGLGFRFRYNYNDKVEKLYGKIKK